MSRKNFKIMGKIILIVVVFVNIFLFSDNGQYQRVSAASAIYEYKPKVGSQLGYSYPILIDNYFVSDDINLVWYRDTDFIRTDKRKILVEVIEVNTNKIIGTFEYNGYEGVFLNEPIKITAKNGPFRFQKTLIEGGLETYAYSRANASLNTGPVTITRKSSSEPLSADLPDYAPYEYFKYTYNQSPTISLTNPANNLSIKEVQAV
jgi:hypothetical protein